MIHLLTFLLLQFLFSFTNALALPDEPVSSLTLSPTPTVHTITFYVPSPFSETIFGMQYTLTSIATATPIATQRSDGVDYTMYVEERVINVPSGTTLAPDFEDDPSVTVSPYTSTITGTLISNGDAWSFETSDDAPIYFTDDCQLEDSNAAIQLSDSGNGKMGLSCDREELGEHGWRGRHFLGDPLPVYTLTVTQDSSLPAFADVLETSSRATSTSMESSRGSNGGVSLFNNAMRVGLVVLPVVFVLA
ncbi:hypothetical protein VKT23_012931 [Stygiomarasmius scandens]|uniref:Uncharacterized protein n=1 Tax=Marasmiellus scandens TaxID=2682957 RepID=A0ABR1J604_9AGAR